MFKKEGCLADSKVTKRWSSLGMRTKRGHYDSNRFLQVRNDKAASNFGHGWRQFQGQWDWGQGSMLLVPEQRMI
jgi:hypothetical protein